MPEKQTKKISQIATISWKTFFPVTGSWFFFWDFIKLYGFFMLLLLLLLGSVLGIVQDISIGEFFSLVKPLGLVFVSVASFIILFVPLIGGDTHTGQYSLDHKKAVMTVGIASIKKHYRFKKISKIAAIFGLFSGSPEALGASLMGATSKRERTYKVSWDKVSKVSASPYWKVVTLYRRVFIFPLMPLRLYCPDEKIYAKVVEVVLVNCPQKANRRLKRLAFSYKA